MFTLFFKHNIYNMLRYENTDSSDASSPCQEINSCLGDPCGPGNCTDIPAPQVGYTCDCDAGYEYNDEEGTCVEIDSCVEYVDACGEHGTCVDLSPPSVGYTCDCDAGYEEVDGTCVRQH